MGADVIDRNDKIDLIPDCLSIVTMRILFWMSNLVEIDYLMMRMMWVQ